MTSKFADMTNVRLECEAKAGKLGGFCKDYTTKTGIAPDMSAVHTIEDKWGVELRVYFDGSDAADRLGSEGHRVENRETGFGSERQYRVNSKDLFWEMVDSGYRLGNN